MESFTSIMSNTIKGNISKPYIEENEIYIREIKIKMYKIYTDVLTNYDI